MLLVKILNVNYIALAIDPSEPLLLPIDRLLIALDAHMFSANENGPGPTAAVPQALAQQLLGPGPGPGPYSSAMTIHRGTM